jgi:hypothetical protein
MELDPWELRDPAALVADIARRVPFEEDTSYVALVRLPSMAQQLIAVKRLPLPAFLDDDDEIGDALCRMTRSFGIGFTGRAPEHAVVTVVVRPGRCLFGPNEAVWCKGWRYSNHLESVYSGDLILVTEHGWADFMSGEAGHQPAMTPAQAAS